MHARAATRTGGTGSICSEERILCKHGDGPLTCLTALTYKSGYFFLCNAEHERAVVVRASPAMAATQQHPSWEFTVVVLSGPGATTDIIGAAEAKGMQLVALHAAAGTAVVAFCTLRKGVGTTLARLLPPSGCLRVYETAAAAQQAVRVASCGGASLCCAITGEAIDASDAASDGSSGGGFVVTVVIGAVCFASHGAAERSAAATRGAHRLLRRGRSRVHAQAPRRREQPRESGARSLAQRAKRHDNGARRGM